MCRIFKEFPGFIKVLISQRKRMRGEDLFFYYLLVSLCKMLGLSTIQQYRNYSRQATRSENNMKLIWFLMVIHLSVGIYSKQNKDLGRNKFFLKLGNLSMKIMNFLFQIKFISII